MNLYREEDIQAITDNLDRIIDETISIRNEHQEPTITEYRRAMIIVNDFIRRKKRIVYGGNAFDTLSKHKDKNDGIYANDSRKDVEFYSPEPIEDMVELCNVLHDAKFPWVQGKQAQHEATYTIFVNFENVCDMTYMPRNIYSNMPVIKLNGILYSDTTWIMIDVLRQHNDPMLSYQRVKDKTFGRANVLFRHYPLDLHTKQKFKYTNVYDNKRQQLFFQLIQMDSILFAGSIARKYYSTLTREIDFSALEVFTTDFCEDVPKINAIIKKIFGTTYSDLTITLYRPFFQFWDERIEFKLNGEPIITIFGPNEICIPYNNLFINDSQISRIQMGGLYKNRKSTDDKNCIKIVTFMVLFNHILIHRQYEFINRTEVYKKYEYELHVLLQKRKEHLEKEVATVMDNTPYREFVVKCAGTIVDQRRKYFLEIMNKKLKRKNPTFSYTPATQKNTFNLPDYKFTNISGNPNEKEKNKLL